MKAACLWWEVEHLKNKQALNVCAIIWEKFIDIVLDLLIHDAKCRKSLSSKEGMFCKALPHNFIS
jgi:hypothetical protein